MNEQGKSCMNCKHFKRYYVLNVSLRFVPIDEGFCCHCNINRRIVKKNVTKDDSCSLWQSRELQKITNRYIAEEILQDISKKLESIRAILDD